MRHPLRIVLVAAATVIAAAGGYALYWHAAAGTLARGIDDWTSLRRAEGYEVAHGAPAIGGFPFRLEAVLADPVIAAPAGDAMSWRWAGPSLTLSARPWAPLDAEASAPGRHDIEIVTADGMRRYVVDATGAAGRARFAADGRIERGEARFADLLVAEEGVADTLFVAEEAAITIIPEGAAADHTRPSLGFQLSATGALLPPQAATPLGRKLDRLELDGTVLGRIEMQERTVREALERWRDDGGTLELARLAAQWGPLGLAGSGTFALDARLQPIGAMSTTISGHEAAIDALVEARVVGARDGGLAKILLAVLSRPSPVDGTPELTAPLTLQDGWLWVGPARLVPVPPLDWP